MAWGETAVGMGLGLALGNEMDERQRHQARRVQAIEMQGAKEMSEFNRQQQMKLWHDTNYSAQIAEMQKAGLNVGLASSKGPGQGGTAQANTGAVSGIQAERQNESGMAMQLGMQNALTTAQIENVKANTNKTNVEADKIAGVDTTETQERTTGLQWDNKMKEIESRIKTESEQEIISQIRTASDAAIGEAKSKMANGNLDQRAFEQRVKQIEQTTVEQQLRMSAIKAGVIKTETETSEIKAKIDKIANEVINIKANTVATKEGVRQTDEQITNQQKALLLQKMQTEFNTSDAAQLKQWSDAIWSLIIPGSGLPQGQRPIGFK